MGMEDRKMKPILFNTEMVRAIIGGIKAQSRRPVKWDISNNFDIDAKGSAVAYINPETGDSYAPVEAYKYQKGDTLWVRETWAQLDMDYRVVPGKIDIDEFKGCPIVYKADHMAGNDGTNLISWRPSSHMPKDAARILLKVNNIRVERLHKITELDVVGEGFRDKLDGNYTTFYPGWYYFVKTWNGIYSKRGYG